LASVELEADKALLDCLEIKVPWEVRASQDSRVLSEQPDFLE